MTTSNSINSRSTGYLLLKAHNIFLWVAAQSPSWPTCGSEADAHAGSNAAHYIYTTRQVQYKRLFEMAAAPVNHRGAAHDWQFCRIDHNSGCGQDTVGFALVVGFSMLADGKGAADNIQVNDCAVRSLHTRMPQMFGIWRFPCFRRLVHCLKGCPSFCTETALARSDPAVIADAYQPPGKAGRLSFHRRVTRNP
jgi:hypothetical protein